MLMQLYELLISFATEVILSPLVMFGYWFLTVRFGCGYILRILISWVTVRLPGPVYCYLQAGPVDSDRQTRPTVSLQSLKTFVNRKFVSQFCESTSFFLLILNKSYCIHCVNRQCQMMSCIETNR